MRQCWLVIEHIDNLERAQLRVLQLNIRDCEQRLERLLKGLRKEFGADFVAIKVHKQLLSKFGI